MNDFSPPVIGRAATATLLAACIAALSGCWVYHSDKNRPGEVDITESPPRTDVPERVQPDDPMAWQIAGSVRPLFEAGWIWTDGVSESGNRFGAELSVSLNTEVPVKSAPFNSDGLFGFVSLPQGVVVGAVPTDFDGYSRWQIYAEADARAVPYGRISGGWAVHPAAGHHGPQLTVGLAELFHARWHYALGRGATFTLGASIPFYGVYVRSH